MTPENEAERIEEAERKHYEQLCAELATLRAENERLRAALKPFADEWEAYRAAFVAHLGREPKDGEERNVFTPDLMLISDCRRAAAALEGQS